MKEPRLVAGRHRILHEQRGSLRHDADGSGESRSSPPADMNVYGVLAWSPDGQRIAFHAMTDILGTPITHVYLMNADGSGVHRLTSAVLHG